MEPHEALRVPSPADFCENRKRDDRPSLPRLLTYTKEKGQTPVSSP
jgi:hypothetical protein